MDIIPFTQKKNGVIGRINSGLKNTLQDATEEGKYWKSPCHRIGVCKRCMYGTTSHATIGGGVAYSRNSYLLTLLGERLNLIYKHNTNLHYTGLLSDSS